MNIYKYISNLKEQHNIVITADGEDLKIQAPREALTNEMIEEIRARKSEMIDFFKTIHWQETHSAISPAEKKQYYPLSSVQQRLYFIQELDKTSLAYNLPQMVTLEGPVNKQQLINAFNSIVARHEILRTSFEVTGEMIIQKISAQVEMEVEYFNATEAEVESISRQFIRPFELSRCPLMRVGLIELAEEHHILMVDSHHIITDGVSQGIMIAEFMALYNKEALPLPALQYKDYAVWQQSAGHQNKTAAAREFWREVFSGEVAELDLPADYPRPPAKSYEGSAATFELSTAQTAQLKVIAERQNATMFMVLLSVYNILLSKLSNQADIVVGVPATGRQHPDVERMMGMFVNTLPLRNYPNGKLPFDQFLSAVKANVLACFDKQDYQYEALIDDLQIPRNASRNPLFDVMFAYQNFRQVALEIPGLKVTPFKRKQIRSKFDITLFAFEREDKITLELEYATGLFKRETIHRFITYFNKIISAITADETVTLAAINILTEEEERQILHEFNNTQTVYPKDKTIIDLFEEQVARTPADMAVKCGRKQLDYAALNHQKDQWALRLTQAGVTTGNMVGILLERDIHLIPCLLGILKAGAAYVPIDISFPDDRINTIIADAGIKVLITERKRQPAALPGNVLIIDPHQSDEPVITEDPVIPESVTGEDTAYVIYTSGSTGKPKGVMIAHHSLVNYVTWAARCYLGGAPAVFPLFTPVSFDLTVTAIFTPLITGGSIIVYPDDKEKLLIEQVLADNEATVIKLTPSHLRIIRELTGIKEYATKKWKLIVGGEDLPAQLAQDITDLFGGQTDIYNEYGPTEATVGCMIYKFDPADGFASVPIGIPIQNSRIYILDEALNPVPDGVPGELYIGGDGLAKGYLNNKPLTAERFITAAHLQEQKLYRTGDVAIRNVNGNILFKGRIDQQVKVRGFRIELGEISYQLSAYGPVTDAVVVCRERNDKDKYLTAYYLSEKEIAAATLRSYLSDKLPSYMLPEYYVRLESIPLTTNGKLDERSLPEPEMTAGELYVGPAGKTEEQLVEIWSAVLKIDRHKISVTKSFFELGGHSLRILLMLNKVSRELHVEVAIKDVFRHETIRSLSAHIQALELVDYFAIPKAPEQLYYALSAAQRRMFFLHEFDPSSLGYNVSQVIKLEGVLDKERLQQTFNKLIARHEILHTAFLLVDGEPVQQVAEKAAPGIEYIKATAAEAPAVIEAFIRPFDLGKPPLIRTGIIEIAAEEHLLIVDMHHIVTDGVSEGMLIKDFMALYGNEILPPLQLQYKDYAAWQQTAAHQEKTSRQKDFWLNVFSTAVTSLELPADDVRPLIKNDAGDSLHFELGEKETDQLKYMAEREGVTMFMLLLSIYHILLSKLSNQEDIVIGVPTAGRQHADLENMIGVFVNTLPLRNDAAGEQDFSGFLTAVKANAIACFDNQDYLYEQLIDDLQVARNPGRNPLFDAMFSYENYENRQLEMPGLVLKPYPVKHTISKFDITLSATEKDKRIYLNFEYSTVLFKAATIQRFADYFKEIVNTVVRHDNIRIADIQLLTAKEQQQLLFDFNNTTVEYPREETFIDLFSSCVRRMPERVAVVHNNEQLDYRSLDELSDRVAHWLLSKAIRKGQVISLLLKRDISLLAFMIGIQKAGGVFVAIDVRNPAQRIKKILEDSQPELIIAAGDYASLVMDMQVGIEVLVMDHPAVQLPGMPDEKLLPRMGCDDLTYLVYTSGSTGEPKGVLLHQDGMVNHFRGLKDLLHLDENDCFAQTAECSFDVYVVQFLLMLTVGGCTHIVDREDIMEPARLQQLLLASRMTIMELVPSVIRSLLWNEAAPHINGLRWLLTTGEEMPVELAVAWNARYPEIPLVNMYGPAEASDDVSAYIIPADLDNRGITTIPVGKPLANFHLYILNKHLQLCPVGVRGEICISGIGVGRGYSNDAIKTQEKFIGNPFASDSRHATLYRTGDIGYWQEDGNIVLQGRADNMVKVRGARIETKEVEKALSSHENIQDAVVTAGERGAEKYLVAYYVSAQPLPATVLREYLLARLPDYMVPAYYVQLNKLPLTVNGKLDRHALPAPIPDSGSTYEGGRNKEEAILIQVWEAVLGVTGIGIHDNFFSIGGDSIKSIQISARMRSLGYEVSVKAIFQRQTISELSKHMKVLTRISDQSAVTGRSALTPIQQLFFNESARLYRHHYNQSVLLQFPDGISQEMIRQIFGKLQSHHDALRMVFREEDGNILSETQGMEWPVWVTETDLRDDPDAAGSFSVACNLLQSGIDLSAGPLMRLGLFRLQDGSRLLIVIHHLVVDGVSWRILLEDIGRLYRQLMDHVPLNLPLKTDAFQSWTGHLLRYTQTPAFEIGRRYWAHIASEETGVIPRDNAAGRNLEKDLATETFTLSGDDTRKLTGAVHKSFRTQVNDILLTALLLSIREQYEVQRIKVDLEGHGREEILEDVNVSRTVGWFTSFYPVTLDATGGHLSDMIKRVKEMLRAVPHQGIDYLIEQYLLSGKPDNAKKAQLCFNYLGQFDTDTEGYNYHIAADERGAERSPEAQREYEWDVSGLVSGGRLEMHLSYSKDQYKAATIQQLMASYQRHLEAVIAYCCNYGKEELTPADLTYKGLTITQLDALQQRYEVEDIYPLSPMQEGMLFHSLLDEEADNYFEQVSYHWKGKLDVSAVEQGMNELLARYDILRTAFIHEGYERPLQVVLKARTIECWYKDIREWCVGQSGEDVVATYRLEDRARKFDLSRDIPMRLTILQTHEDEYEFIWSHHHILMDGWCMGIIVKELTALYAHHVEGRALSLPAVTPYARYIGWLENRDKAAAEAYWRSYLDSYDHLSTLPKKEIPAKHTKAYLSKYESIHLDKNITGLLHKVSREHGVTLNTIIQAAWGILLFTYNNTTDVLFGSVVSGRPAEITGIETMVGLFINAVPVRIKVNAGDTIDKLLKQVQDLAIESEQYHYTSLSDIQSLSELKRGLLDHIMVFENYPISDEIEKAGEKNSDANSFAITDVQVFEQTNYDLTLIVTPGEEIRIRIDYNGNIYDDGRIAMVAAQLGNIIGEIASGSKGLVADINILTPAEKHRLLEVFNDTAAAWPGNSTVIDLFEAQVSATPDHIAVKSDDEQLSYREFNQQKDQLAALLIRSGVLAGELVGVMLDREIRLVPSVYGIMKAGAVYVPIDPLYPADRIHTIIGDAGIKTIITCSKYRSSIAAESLRVIDLDTDWEAITAQEAVALKTATDSKAPAYVIYTSGSTGKPKGVVIRHYSLVNLLHHMQVAHPLLAEDRYLLKTTYSFDVSMTELFGWFHAGGSLSVLAAGGETDLEILLTTIEKDRITHINFVPSMFSVFVDHIAEHGLARLRSLKYIFVAGEALPNDLVSRFHGLQSGIVLSNYYGPTEATVYGCGYETVAVSGYDRVPIGKPISNVTAYVVGANGQLQPIGVAGELYLGGAGIASGYLGDEALTRERFITDHFTGEGHLYKTGDLARWLPGGQLDFIGRRDEQVKIRGFRIELSEITHHLKRYGQITDAVVIARKGEGEQYLAGYYVSAQPLSATQLREYLLSLLPDYMVPFYYVHLAALPLTGSGKIDRKALPAPELGADVLYGAARNKEEALLVQVWESVLGTVGIGIYDNFFSVGGDSIKSIQISARMRNHGYEVSVKEIFHNQTIAELAKHLKVLSRMPDQSPVTGRSILTPIQRQFFRVSEPLYRHHYNQSVLLQFPDGISKEQVTAIFGKLQSHHDALRMVFREEDGVMLAETLGITLPVRVTESDLRAHADAQASLHRQCDALQAGIDLSAGPLMQLGLYHLPDGSRLQIVIHHLVVDGVSWRILFEDIDQLYRQLLDHLPLRLPLKTDPFQSWADHLLSYTRTASFEQGHRYWEQINREEVAPVHRDNSNGTNLVKDMRVETLRLSSDDTRKLLSIVHRSFHTQVNDILLAGLLLSIRAQYGTQRVKIDLEGHGREEVVEGVNIGRTVGWFTSYYPVILEATGSHLSDTIRQVKETLRAVPNDGIDYLIAQYLPEDKPADVAKAQICFNYLGQFDTDTTGRLYRIAPEPAGKEASPEAMRMYEWEVSGMVTGGCLEMYLSYSQDQYDSNTIHDFMGRYKAILEELITYCSNYGREELTPSDLTYKGLSIAQLDHLQQQYQVEDIYPLSPMQAGMLFHSLLDETADHYFEQVSYRWSGKLNTAAVEQSMNDLFARYDILRTVFLNGGYERPLQLVLKARNIDFSFQDIREQCATGSKDVLMKQFRAADRARKFDLGRDVLMRLGIFQTGEAEYEFIWSHHHILMDGWCMAIIAREFTALYAYHTQGKPILLPAITPYSRYISWLEGRDKLSAENYWRRYLDGFESASVLPQKEVSKEYLFRSREFTIDKAATQLLHKASREHGVTLNTIFQCAWGILLSRYNNSADVVFGSVVSGRPAEITGIETMVGLLMNTVPVRIVYNETTGVKELLQEIQDHAISGEPYHHYPLPDIQSLSELGRELMDHIMVFENLPVEEPVTGNEPFTMSYVDYTVQTNYDLNVIIMPSAEYKIQFDYNANRYEEDIITDLIGYFKNILLSIAGNSVALVKDISLYSASQQAALQEKYTIDLEGGIAVATIQEQLAGSFAKHAGKCALEHRGVSFTYAAIAAKADKVAAMLSRRQLPEGSFVGILCEDRASLICSILGILQARMVFVPLEITLPARRLSSMIDQIQPGCSITDQPQELCHELAQNTTWVTIAEINAEEALPEVPRPVYALTDAVYVYFTSGTTGHPKGVVGRNKGLSHFIAWEISRFNLDASFRCSQFVNPGFDVFMRDILVPLCCGGTICVPDTDVLSTGEGISRWIDREGIRLIHSVPSFFRLWSKDNLEEGLFSELKYVLLAGEKILPYELTNWFQVFDNRIQLVNIYGPTETTLAKGYYLIQPGDTVKPRVPVHPITGAQFLLLDRYLHVCPRQSTGEIYIRTPYRTAGYFKQEAANRQAFIGNPFGTDSTDILYKTGDLGKTANADAVDILGRQDHQVKLRGIRIELDDIRENILHYPGITDAVVVAREDKAAEMFICAYVVPADATDQSLLRKYLAEILPGYMVPAYIIPLAALPLTPNGKLDRKALPDPLTVLSETKQVLPVGYIEQKMAAIWSELLKTDQALISATSSFFEMGGHSLKVFFLINMIQQEFSVKIKLGDVFQHTSIRTLSAFIADLGTGEAVKSIPKAEKRKYYPVSPAQERMYYQHLLHKDSLTYNIAIPIKIKGETAIDKIAHTFQQLVNRHASLRTNFILTDKGVIQIIHPSPVFELSLLDPVKYDTPEKAFHDFVRPFDLSNDLLIRCGILQDKNEGDFLFVDLHHIIADGTALNILVNEFNKLYEGASLPPLPLSYTDFACWISNTKGKLENQQKFWLEKLSGELPKLDLPVSQEKTDRDPGLAAVKVLLLNGSVYSSIRQFTASANVSDFMFLLSVYYILLSKISAATDIIVGTDVIGRTQAGLRDIVGTFVNILPLRVKIDDESTYLELLGDVKECVLQAFDNQDFQFDQMVSLLGRNADIDENPLVNVHFAFSNTSESDSRLAGNEFEFFPLAGSGRSASKYELSLEVTAEDGKMEIAFIYNSNLYEDDTIELLKDYYQHILLAVLENAVIDIKDIRLEESVENVHL
jgi:iturin family lipopeptide synthetase B